MHCNAKRSGSIDRNQAFQLVIAKEELTLLFHSEIENVVSVIVIVCETETEGETEGETEEETEGEIEGEIGMLMFAGYSWCCYSNC